MSEALFSANVISTTLMCVMLFFSMFARAIHLFLQAELNARKRAAVIVHELAILVCMLALSGLAYGAAGYTHPLHMHFLPLSIPADVLLYVNLVCAVAALVSAVALKSPWGFVDGLIICPVTSLGMHFFEGSEWIVLAAVTCYLLFRCFSLLWGDFRFYYTSITRHTKIEALTKLPEGLLYANQHHFIVYMNDAMRVVLRKLNLTTDYSDAKALWDNILKFDNHVADLAIDQPEDPQAQFCLVCPDNAQAVLFVRMPPSRTSGIEDECILAVDVSEEFEIMRQTAQVNEQIELENDELRKSMATLAQSADDEARLVMRSRVHDVIGQRLSILHRLLEDGTPSDRAVDKIKPLLNTILVDLAFEDRLTPNAELDAVMHSFELVETPIRIEGELPLDPRAARCIVHVLREAATNAIRHGHARSIRVVIQNDSGASHVIIDNDGEPAHENARESTGIATMRKLVAELGGTISITTAPTYTIELELPYDEREASHD